MADYISTENIADQEVSRERDLDNITILPTTSTVEIRTLYKYKNSAGGVIRTAPAQPIILMDKPADVEHNILERTEFTDFLSALSLTKSAIRSAIISALTP